MIGPIDPTGPGPSLAPVAPEDGKKGGLGAFLDGIEPWMVAAAAGVGAGVLIGLRVSQLIRPKNLPPRVCPECEKRERAIVTRHVERATVSSSPATVPRPDPTDVPARESTATLDPAPLAYVPTERVSREFSAAALPDDAGNAEPIIDPGPPDDVD